MRTIKRPTLENLAAQRGLDIEYCDDLPDAVCGFLDPSPDPQYIRISTRHPQWQQRFTIAHELAHHDCMHDGKCRQTLPEFMHGEWKNAFVAEQIAWLKDSVTNVFTEEHEADLVACVLLAICGEHGVMRTVFENYPHKAMWCGLNTLCIPLFRPHWIVKALVNRVFRFRLS